MDKTQHHTSRVKQACLKLRLMKARWVWDKFEVSGRYVLPDGKEVSLKTNYLPSTECGVK